MGAFEWEENKRFDNEPLCSEQQVMDVSNWLF